MQVNRSEILLFIVLIGTSAVAEPFNPSAGHLRHGKGKSPLAPADLEQRRLQVPTAVHVGDLVHGEVGATEDVIYVLKSPDASIFPVDISVTPDTAAQDPDLYVSCDFSFPAGSYKSSTNSAGAVDTVTVNTLHDSAAGCSPGHAADLYIKVTGYTAAQFALNVEAANAPFDGTVLVPGASPISASTNGDSSVSFAVMDLAKGNFPVTFTMQPMDGHLTMEVTCNSLNGANGRMSSTFSPHSSATLQIVDPEAICGPMPHGARANLYALVAGTSGPTTLKISVAVATPDSSDDDASLPLGSSTSGSSSASLDTTVYAVTDIESADWPVYVYLKPEAGDHDLTVSCNADFGAPTYPSAAPSNSPDFVTVPECDGSTVYVQVSALAPGDFSIGAFPLTPNVLSNDVLSVPPVTENVGYLTAEESKIFALPLMASDAPATITLTNMDADLDLYVSCTAPRGGPADFRSGLSVLKSQHSGTMDDTVVLSLGDAGCTPNGEINFAYVLVYAYNAESWNGVLQVNSAAHSDDGYPGGAVIGTNVMVVSSGTITTGSLWEGAYEVYEWADAMYGGGTVELDPDYGDLDLAIGCTDSFNDAEYQSTLAGSANEYIYLDGGFFRTHTDSICADGSVYIIIKAYESSSFTLYVDAHRHRATGAIVATAVTAVVIAVVVVCCVRRRRRCRTAKATALSAAAAPPVAAASETIDASANPTVVTGVVVSGGNSNAVPTAATVAPSVARAVAVVASGDGRCGNCRGLIAPGSRFCSTCGHPVGTSAPATVV